MISVAKFAVSNTCTELESVASCDELHKRYAPPRTYLDPAGSSVGGTGVFSHRGGITRCSQLLPCHCWHDVTHRGLREVYTQHSEGLRDADDALAEQVACEVQSTSCTAQEGTLMAHFSTVYMRIEARSQAVPNLTCHHRHIPLQGLGSCCCGRHQAFLPGQPLPCSGPRAPPAVWPPPLPPATRPARCPAWTARSTDTTVGMFEPRPPSSCSTNWSFLDT